MNNGRPEEALPAHEFGGRWTEQKLDVLARYLAAYAKALKDKPDRARPFRKAYIDAFAGTGYRSSETDAIEGSTDLLFSELAEAEPQRWRDGSARIALRTHPPFDRYIFIDLDPKRCAALESLKVEFPELADRILVQPGDANERIRSLCNKPWRSHRAVLFLDPYGMQVEWATLKAVARTRAIDLWLLFPLGMGVRRLLKKSGDIPPSWRRRLDTLFGTEGWYDEFYAAAASPTLFGSDEERVCTATVETIGRYFNERLKTIFAGVAPEPVVLRNSRKSPLYLLSFAVGNKRGKEVALRIANHLLKEMR